MRYSVEVSSSHSTSIKRRGVLMLGSFGSLKMALNGNFFLPHVLTSKVWS